MRMGRMSPGSSGVSSDDWLGLLCIGLVILLITVYLVSRGHFRD